MDAGPSQFSGDSCSPSPAPAPTRNSLTAPRLKLHRVDLAHGLAQAIVVHSGIRRDFNLGTRGRSSFEHRPDGEQLILSGCRVVGDGICVQRWMVFDPYFLALLDEVDAAGTPAFVPGTAVALGWDGARDAGHIINCVCYSNDDVDLHLNPIAGMDHWLVTTDLDSRTQQIIDVPGYQPTYLVTGGGPGTDAYGLVATTDCETTSLFAVDLATGSATAIEDGHQDLGYLALTDDPGVVFSVYDQHLYRIDLEALTETRFGPNVTWNAVAYLPDRDALVVATTDMLKLWLLDATTGQMLDLFYLGATPSQRWAAPPPLTPPPRVVSAPSTARPLRIRRLDFPLGQFYRL
jgi:hypothetical protein